MDCNRWCLSKTHVVAMAPPCLPLRRVSERHADSLAHHFHRVGGTKMDGWASQQRMDVYVGQAFTSWLRNPCLTGYPPTWGPVSGCLADPMAAPLTSPVPPCARQYTMVVSLRTGQSFAAGPSCFGLGKSVCDCTSRQRCSLPTKCPPRWCNWCSTAAAMVAGTSV